MGVRSETGQATTPASSGPRVMTRAWVRSLPQRLITKPTSEWPRGSTCNQGYVMRRQMTQLQALLVLAVLTPNSVVSAACSVRQSIWGAQKHYCLPSLLGWGQWVVTLAFENLCYDCRTSLLKFHSLGLMSGFPSDDFWLYRNHKPLFYVT